MDEQLKGTTYSCEHENIEARKDYLCLFRNNKQWLKILTESETYLIRQMARFVLKESENKPLVRIRELVQIIWDSEKGESSGRSLYSVPLNEIQKICDEET